MFSTVYQCWDRHSDTRCCIKKITFMLVNDENSLAISATHYRIVQREIYLLLHLQHPNIVRLWDVFQTDENMYLVMELADHGTLKTDIDARHSIRKMYKQKVYIYTKWRKESTGE